MLINLNVLYVGLMCPLLLSSCLFERQNWQMSYRSNLIEAVQNPLMPANWSRFISITLILESCLKQL